MPEWRALAVEDMAAPSKYSLATGPFGSEISSRFFTATGVPVIRGSNLSLDVGLRLVDNDLVFIPAELARQFHRSMVRAGDLVFTCWGTIGQVGLVENESKYPEYIVSNKQMKLTPDTSIASSLFLYYAFSNQSFVERLTSISIGSSVPGFNLGQLKKLTVLVPSLAEQRAITGVLGALDDKIAANDRTARTSADLAEALYKRLVAQASRAQVVGDLLDLRYGKPLTAATRVTGNVPVYGSGGISGSHDQALVTGPGIVVGRKGSVGTVYWSETDFFPIDTTFYVERRSDSVPMEFIFAMLRHLGLDTMNADSAVPGLNRGNVLALPVWLPATDDLRRFQASVRPGFALRGGLSAESATLARLRDAMLPRLMSGEIRVRDAEKIAADAT